MWKWASESERENHNWDQNFSHDQEKGHDMGSIEEEEVKREAINKKVKLLKDS